MVFVSAVLVLFDLTDREAATSVAVAAV